MAEVEAENAAFLRPHFPALPICTVFNKIGLESKNKIKNIFDGIFHEGNGQEGEHSTVVFAKIVTEAACWGGGGGDYAARSVTRTPTSRFRNN